MKNQPPSPNLHLFLVELPGTINKPTLKVQILQLAEMQVKNLDGLSDLCFQFGNLSLI